MSEARLNVMLIGKTFPTVKFYDKTAEMGASKEVKWELFADGTRAIALTAIRACYSSNKPTEILAKEGDRYFGRDATDGEGGKEADRLIRHIIRSKHTSTLEHISYTFAIEGLSRSALTQLTRHRHFSFSVQSQRYVRFGSEDRTGGFDYVIPPMFSESDTALFAEHMERAQEIYNMLRAAGVPPEDARFVLPNAAVTNLVLSGNLRTILEFYSKRKHGRGAQWEIANLAEQMRTEIVEEDPWTDALFEHV